MFSVSTAKHEVVYKNPSKLKLAEFEKIVPPKPVNFHLGEVTPNSDESDFEDEDFTTELRDNPSDLNENFTPLFVIDDVINPKQRKFGSFRLSDSDDEPFSYFRHRAISNNSEGNEDTYICSSNFKSPEKTDAGPLNDSLMTGGNLYPPKLHPSMSTHSLSISNLPQVKQKRLEFMLNGRTQKISGSTSRIADKPILTTLEVIPANERKTNSLTPSGQPIKNHISFSDECDNQPIRAKQQKLFTSVVDVTDENGAHMRNEDFLQPGSANHRLKVQLTVPENSPNRGKNSGKSADRSQYRSRTAKLESNNNKFISLQEERSAVSSKETYL